jgi:hypothetical protein
MRPKYMAGPIRVLSNARFIPHIGNNVPFGMVITISTNLSTRIMVNPLQLSRIQHEEYQPNCREKLHHPNMSGDYKIVVSALKVSQISDHNLHE